MSDKESHNVPQFSTVSPVNVEKEHTGSGEPQNAAGLNSGDVSATSPVANNEITEHDDKNVAGPSGVKIGDLSSANSPAGANNEVKDVAGPSRVNVANSGNETVSVDVVGTSSGENENRGQLEAEEQMGMSGSSSSSNDVESSGEN